MKSIHIKFNDLESANLAFELLRESSETSENFTILEKMGFIKLFETIFEFTKKYLEVYLDELVYHDMKHNLRPNKYLKDYKFSEFMVNYLFEKVQGSYMKIIEDFFKHLDLEIKRFGISFDDLLVLKMFLCELDLEDAYLFSYDDSINTTSKTINLVVGSNPDDVLYYINKSKYFKYFFSVIDVKEFQKIERLSNKKFSKLIVLGNIK